MKITKIPGFGNYGEYIDDLDFAHLSEEEWLEIGRRHLKCLLTVIRNPKGLTKDGYLERIDQFGPDYSSGMPLVLAKKYGRPVYMNDIKTQKGIDKEDLEYLLARKNMMERTEKGNMLPRVTGLKDDKGRMLGSFDSGDLGWHSNESSQLTLAPEVSLWGNQYMVGSATGFVQTADYYESVSNSFRSELDEMIIVHTYKEGAISPAEFDNVEFRKLIHANFCPVDGAETPLVMTNPGGVRGLHYTVNSTHSIKGMTQEESNKIFKQIDDALFTDKYMYLHYYEYDNDLLLFDNCITLHNRLKGNVNRKAYRLQYMPYNLMDDAWYPYDQPEILDRYIELTHELVKRLPLPIKNPKLPIKRDKLT